MSFWPAYRRLYRGARTINRVNNLHILLEQRLTPDDVSDIAYRALFRFLPQPLEWMASLPLRLADFVLRKRIPFPGINLVERRVAQRNWIIMLQRKVALASPTTSVSYRRQTHGPGAFLFTSNRPSGELLIAFGPRTRQLTVAMPVFLSALSATGHDLLFIRPELRNPGPWTAVVGFESGFDGLIGHLQTLIQFRSYGEVHTVGLSFSATLALLVGLSLPANTVTPIGLTRHPQFQSGEVPTLWDTALRKKTLMANKAQSRVQFVFGQSEVAEKSLVHSMAQSIPESRVIEVKGAGHSPLGHLLREGDLQAFVTAMVSGFGNDVLPASCAISLAT
jgi:pimeloyl-ACP methyl ester carboxylesterase